MTEAMPFLRNTILLSYDTRSLRWYRFFLNFSPKSHIIVV